MKYERQMGYVIRPAIWFYRVCPIPHLRIFPLKVAGYIRRLVIRFTQ